MSKPMCCVVGAGVIGTHHIRSLMESGYSVSIVDPFSKKVPSTEYNRDLNDRLLQKCGIYIVSTHAKERFRYLMSIIENDSDNIVVLEKPLFENHTQYREFQSIESKNVYVNTPLYDQIYRTYTKFGKKLGRLTKYESTGVDWGICCNLMHDISVFDGCTNANTLALGNVSVIVDNWKPAKRSSYIELNGSIGTSINGAVFSLNCKSVPGARPSKITEISFESGTIKIDYARERLTIWYSGDIIFDNTFTTPRASETTGHMISQILDGNLVLPQASKYSNIADGLYYALSKHNPADYGEGFYPYT